MSESNLFKKCGEAGVAVLEHSHELEEQPSLRVQSILPALESEGYVLLPGLTRWLDILSPLRNKQAWTALHNPNVQAMMRPRSPNDALFFLNDLGVVDDHPQNSVGFVAKDEKSHLSIVEGTRHLGLNQLLPRVIADYFQKCNEFLEEMRSYFSDVIPGSSLPTVLKMRVFDYHASDLIINLRPRRNVRFAMKPHVDGSVLTLIIARSDGLLRFYSRGRWRAAVRSDNQPFAMIIPGAAAAHDLGLKPTPHMVMPGFDDRVSVTLFLTPMLHKDRGEAIRRLSQWRLCDSEELPHFVS